MSNDEKREHEEPETGAEGQGSSGLSVPFEPSPEDETPLGDTDQHSKVDHDQDPADENRPSNAAGD